MKRIRFHFLPGADKRAIFSTLAKALRAPLDHIEQEKAKRAATVKQAEAKTPFQSLMPKTPTMLKRRTKPVTRGRLAEREAVWAHEHQKRRTGHTGGQLFLGREWREPEQYAGEW